MRAGRSCRCAAGGEAGKPYSATTYLQRMLRSHPYRIDPLTCTRCCLHQSKSYIPYSIIHAHDSVMSTQYDGIGTSYDEMRKLPVALLERSNVQAAVTPYIHGARVLDLACGTGYYSQFLLTLGRIQSDRRRHLEHHDQCRKAVFGHKPSSKLPSR